MVGYAPLNLLKPGLDRESCLLLRVPQDQLCTSMLFLAQICIASQTFQTPIGCICILCTMSCMYHVTSHYNLMYAYCALFPGIPLPPKKFFPQCMHIQYATLKSIKMA